MHLRNRRVLQFLSLWLGLFTFTMTWALTTPLGGSPDEPAHIIKAASVVRGELVGEPADRGVDRWVTVPKTLGDASAWPCFAFQADSTADCANAAIDTEQGEERAITAAGLYNPVYYALVGLPSVLFEHPRMMVFGMRAISAAITTFLLAVTLMALFSFGRRALAVVVFLAVATPMTYFLNAAVNPNGMEIAAGAAFLALLASLTLSEDRRYVGTRLALVVVSGTLLLNSRAISPAWAFAIAIAVVIASPPRRLVELFRDWRVWVAVALIGAAAAFAVLWVISSNTLQNLGTYIGAGEVTFDEAFREMLFDRSFDLGLVGVFGWLDVPSPTFTYVVWSALGTMVVLLGLSLGWSRRLLATLVLAAAFLLGPPLFQAFSVENSGYIWQGRYSLAIYVAFILMAGITAMVAVPRVVTSAWSPVLRRGFWVVVVLAAIAHLVPLVVAMRRYAIGVEGDWADLLSKAVWQPPLGIVFWIVVGVAAQVALALAFRSVIRHDRGLTPAHDESDADRDTGGAVTAADVRA